MTIQTPALVAGQGNSGDNINRDLEQVISNIDRQDTPFYSSIGSRKVTHTNHEWLTDSYQDAEFQAYSENVAIGGTAQGSVTGASDQVREVLSNNTQIFRGTYAVSDTSVAVDTAGVANEFNYQAMKSGVFVRRNVEAQFLALPSAAAADGSADGAVDSRTASVRGSLKRNANGTGATDGRIAGSVFAYAATHWTPGAVAAGNTVREVEVDNAGNVSDVTAAVTTDLDAFAPRANGTSTVVGTNGSAQSFTRQDINALLALMYEKGAKPTAALMSPQQKTRISDVLFADGAGSGNLIQRIDHLSKKVNMAITGVMTDFGFELALIPNWMYNNKATTGRTDPGTILFYDPSMVKAGILRPLSSKRDIGQDTDGMRGFLRCEKTLIVQNPDSVGVLHNVTL